MYLNCSVATLNVDFSQPCRVLRGMLCRRYGVRYHAYYMLQYEGTGKYVCQPTHSTRKIWWLLHISIAKTHQKKIIL